MKNLLVGAISGNYTVSDIQNWVESSKKADAEKLLLLYNKNNENIFEYCSKNSISIIQPEFDFWGRKKDFFNFNTGICDLEISYDLIHNIRFYHIWYYLKDKDYNKVLITDVKDVFFNSDPFTEIDADKLTASSEEITYSQDSWNMDHLYTNLGLCGVELMSEEKVYNVGVFGGGLELVKNICMDIFLLSSGKFKVADQTSFNYLINTKYKKETKFSGLLDNFAVHLHVVNSGLVNFDLKDLDNYKILHQYDRIKQIKLPI